MGRLKRFGRLISNAPNDYNEFLFQDLDKHIPKIKQYIAQKIVYIFKIPQKSYSWEEWFVSQWFFKHFSELGFVEVLEQKTPEYLSLKKKMNFFGYPDFLVCQNNEWLKLEIEVFSSDYHHGSSYAEIVVCLDQTQKLDNLKLITIKDFYGSQEIINVNEISQFLYVYDEEFRSNFIRFHQQKVRKHLRKIADLLD